MEQEHRRVKVFLSRDQPTILHLRPGGGASWDHFPGNRSSLSPMRRSFVDHVDPSTLCMDIVSPSTFIKSADPWLHGHYPLLRYCCVDFATCGPSRCSRALKALPHQYFYPRRASQASQVQSHVFANSPISKTPVRAYSWVRQFEHLSAFACWILHSIGTHKNNHFLSYNIHPFGFRL